MSYTAVNEELRIYKCHVGDLTGKTVGKFLEQFLDVSLNKMTVIYDREKDIILVNQNFIYSDTVIKTIELCLTGNGEEIEDYIYNHNSLDWLVEVAAIANTVYCIRAVREDSKAGKELCKSLDFGMNVEEAQEI